jgi:hypothetical protein
MPDGSTNPSTPEQGIQYPAHLLAGLGIVVIALLTYPAYTFAFAWLTQPAASSVSNLDYRMDLARADAPELLLIPGFGETLVNRWMQERNELLLKYDDPLVAIEHMRGIGPEKLKVIRQYALGVSPARPNDAIGLPEAP